LIDVTTKTYGPCLRRMVSTAFPMCSFPPPAFFPPSSHSLPRQKGGRALVFPLLTSRARTLHSFVFCRFVKCVRESSFLFFSVPQSLDDLTIDRKQARCHTLFCPPPPHENPKESVTQAFKAPPVLGPSHDQEVFYRACEARG